MQNKATLYLKNSLVDIAIWGDAPSSGNSRNKFYHNERTFELAVPPANIDGRVYVPVRFVCNLFGAPVAVENNVIDIGSIFTAEKKGDMESLRKNPIRISVERVLMNVSDEQTVTYSISPYYPNHDATNIKNWVNTFYLDFVSVTYSDDNKEKIVRYRGENIGVGTIKTWLVDNPNVTAETQVIILGDSSTNTNNPINSDRNTVMPSQTTPVGTEVNKTEKTNNNDEVVKQLKKEEDGSWQYEYVKKSDIKSDGSTPQVKQLKQNEDGSWGWEYVDYTP